MGVFAPHLALSFRALPPQPRALTQFRGSDQQTNLNTRTRMYVNRQVQVASDTQPGRIPDGTPLVTNWSHTVPLKVRKPKFTVVSGWVPKADLVRQKQEVFLGGKVTSRGVGSEPSTTGRQ